MCTRSPNLHSIWRSRNLHIVPCRICAKSIQRPNVLTVSIREAGLGRPAYMTHHLLGLGGWYSRGQSVYCVVSEQAEADSFTVLASSICSWAQPCSAKPEGLFSFSRPLNVALCWFRGKRPIRKCPHPMRPSIRTPQPYRAAIAPLFKGPHPRSNAPPSRQQGLFVLSRSRPCMT